MGSVDGRTPIRAQTNRALRQDRNGEYNWFGDGQVSESKKINDVLTIGAYATESWKHSSFGNKIMKAVEYRDMGVPLSIVSEMHWKAYL